MTQRVGSLLIVFREGRLLVIWQAINELSPTYIVIQLGWKNTQRRTIFLSELDFINHFHVWMQSYLIKKAFVSQILIVEFVCVSVRPAPIRKSTFQTVKYPDSTVIKGQCTAVVGWIFEVVSIVFKRIPL